ncbi:MAG TPA: LysE family translocator [Actinobacteria bacterium]|nr:lysE type translocator [bacterium BMS3Bbin02]HDL42244.1 LysE family translocator [Actinomycetota bacterium]
MTEFLTGLTLGLAAGLAPGPLSALTVTTSLKRGFGAGARVAMSPLVTDVPLVATVVFVIAAVPDMWVSRLSVAGAVALVGLGVWEIASVRLLHREHEGPGDAAGGTSADLLKGAVVNMLSPHPWLFWASVGAPILVTAWRQSPGRAVAFVVPFYVSLVGVKLVLAGVVAASRTRISQRTRSGLVVAGGLLLIVAGIALLVAR